MPKDIWIADDGSEAIVPMESSLDHQLNRLLDENLTNRLKTIKAQYIYILGQ